MNNKKPLKLDKIGLAGKANLEKVLDMGRQIAAEVAQRKWNRQLAQVSPLADHKTVVTLKIFYWGRSLIPLSQTSD
jgi:hypothetical protein